MIFNMWQPFKFKTSRNIFVDKSNGAVAWFETDVLLPGDVICPYSRGYSVENLPWILIEEKPMKVKQGYKYIGKMIQDGHSHFLLEGNRWIKLMSVMKDIGS